MGKKKTKVRECNLEVSLETKFLPFSGINLTPWLSNISGHLYPSTFVLVATLPGNTGRELWMFVQNYLPPLSFLVKCKKGKKIEEGQIPMRNTFLIL